MANELNSVLKRKILKSNTIICKKIGVPPSKVSRISLTDSELVL